VVEEEEKGSGQEEGTVEEDKAEVQEQQHHNDAEQVKTTRFTEGRGTADSFRLGVNGQVGGL
jgi:hypothetical protein